jgi:hypothetical protein
MEYTVRIRHEDKVESIVQMTDGELLKEPDTTCQYRQVDPSHVDYHMIREWIARCRGTHGKRCQILTAKPRRIAKFRLLDCETKAVVECADFTEYVALSYVWGPSSNSEKGHQGLLSNTVIRDAMCVTLQLGFRYIWVDQLCINQSDPQDMSYQLGQMNTICMQSTWSQTQGLDKKLTNF